MTKVFDWTTQKYSTFCCYFFLLLDFIVLLSSSSSFFFFVFHVCDVLLVIALNSLFFSCMPFLLLLLFQRIRRNLSRRLATNWLMFVKFEVVRRINFRVIDSKEKEIGLMWWENKNETKFNDSTSFPTPAMWVCVYSTLYQLICDDWFIFIHGNIWHLKWNCQGMSQWVISCKLNKITKQKYQRKAFGA